MSRKHNIDNILGWNAPHIHMTVKAIKAQPTTGFPSMTRWVKGAGSFGLFDGAWFRLSNGQAVGEPVEF